MSPASVFSLAALAAAASFPAAAQPSIEEPREDARRFVQKVVPAQAAFSESIVRRLKLPPGFSLNLFASGLKNARMMDVAADGTVYLTRREQADVLALRDADGDGRAESVQTFATNLPSINGIAVRGGEILLASDTTVWRSPLSGFAPQVLTDKLPDGGQHANRMVRFGPDGALYVAVGSSCNDCAEANQLERATMIRYSPDGRERQVIANGLRNTIGYDWHPTTGALWGMDQGSDFRGDTVPPEELNRIVAGANYGWPICYADRQVDPVTIGTPDRIALEPGQAKPSGEPLTREQFCARTEPAVLTTDAHAAAMALRFYTGTQFPPEYRQDAFVALRGSWNRGDPVGYKLVRVRFAANGEPQAIEDFMTGFLGDAKRLVFGRPVGVAIATDGALLVSDDTNGAIYRIVYRPQ